MEVISTSDLPDWLKYPPEYLRLVDYELLKFPPGYLLDSKLAKIRRDAERAISREGFVRFCVSS